MSSLIKLSDKRGIYAAYDGKKYITISTYYGVVAESTSIERKYLDETHVIKEETVISFDICEWFGYWSLKDVISRGLKRAEQEFVKKSIQINYHEIEGQQDNLRKSWKIVTEAY